MNVVFAASESVPFIKTGGLADVIGSLPQTLLHEEQVQVSVILPKYKMIPDHFKEKMQSVYRGELDLGWRTLYCGVDQLEYDGITYYFIDNEYYFGRDNIYGYSDDFDEAERFIFFSKAILEVLPHLNLKPDILHLHDWQTAIVPVLLHSHYKKLPFYHSIKTVFTIHNLKYQGVFPRNLLGDALELEDNYFHTEGLEFHGRINFMKGALLYSDKITTVSEMYANEIKHPFFGEGLHGLLQKRGEDLTGILNGINELLYNPCTDSYLFSSFENFEAKKVNKIALQAKLDLPVREVPLIAMISRLVEQKGFDLVLHILDELLQEDIQMVILGTGDGKYEHLLSKLAEQYPHKLTLQLKFDEGLSHKIYAGADLFLMPSLFEPCGLSQLISLRYETVPIVRETGGLKDTIQPFNEYTGEGNGFSFKNYNAHDMLYTIRRAVAFYHNKEQWGRIVRNGKTCDYSWNQSAKKYHDLYKQLV